LLIEAVAMVTHFTTHMVMITQWI